jgi:putative ABC transport system permease protein
MDRFFLYKLSFKNLSAHKLRTYLTLGAIAVGISAIVFLVCFAYGLQKMVTETVTGGDAFKLIDVGTENSQIIKLDDGSVNSIKALGDVKDVQIIINAGAKEKSKGKDVDTSFYGTSGKYLEWAGTKIRWGNMLKENSSSEAVVNSAFLSKLSIDPEKAVGETLTFDVVLPKDLAAEKNESALKDKKYTIIGVIRDKGTPQVYVNLVDMTSAGAKKFSQAKVQVSDPSKVEVVRKQVENLGFKTQYVGDTVSQIDQLFRIFKVVLASFGLIALIVATLGMFNTLTISLLERTKEVALMKILGMRRKEIQVLFLTESIIISLSGGILGIFLGYLIGRITNSILNYVAVNSGGDPVVLFIFPFWFLLMVVFFVLAIGLFTGLYPARRAASVNALDVLRYE